MKKLLVCLAIFLLLPAAAAMGRPTGAQDARVVVSNWLTLDARPLGAKLGGQVLKVQTYKDSAGEPLYHVVYLRPGGFVIVAGDDLVEPVIAFLPKGIYNPSANNPLGALVSGDVPARVREVRRTEHRAVSRGLAFKPAGSAGEAQRKWSVLNNATAPPHHSELTGTAQISDVRVSPLVQSTWDQAGADGSLPPTSYPCYNYYTPPYAPGDGRNMVAGCGATAMAQLMRFWQYPAVGVGSPCFDITVRGAPKTRCLRGGNGTGGPYDWANMPFTTSTATSLPQREAIGALTHDAGVALHTDYDTVANGGSGTYSNYLNTALKNTFKYSNAVYGSLDAGIPTDKLTAMINPNLDASAPVVLGIHGSSAVGHAVLGDGYGYNSSTLYHHLNMGWSGQDDAWYNLPQISTNDYYFYVVDTCIYNVFTSGSGEIISGRVLGPTGSAIAGATVTAVRSGGGTYTATTNSKGIYALKGVPSASSYTVNASSTAYTFIAKTVTTATSTDASTNVGNLWGVDFQGGTIPTVTSPQVSSIHTSTATVSAYVSSNGGLPITAAGVAYGPNANPDISGNKVTGSTTSGTVTINLSGLSSNTTYHFRGYATNVAGTAYTSDVTFITASVAPVATAATGVTTTGFTANWLAPADNASIEYYPVQVSTNPNFTSYQPSGATETHAAVTGLFPGTTYYYRVSTRRWEAVTADSDYSNVISVTLPVGAPIVDSPWASSITTTSVSLSANIKSNGGAPITSCGAAYGRSALPDITGSHVSSSATSGAFLVNVTGLSPNTYYDYRGYATNSMGTSYTGLMAFATLSLPPVATAATGIGPAGFTVNCTAPSGDADLLYEYSAQVSTDSAFTAPRSFTSSTTSIVTSGLSSRTTYYYRVRVQNPAGWSDYSNVISVTTLEPEPPTLSSPSSFSYSPTTVMLEAHLDSDGGSPITVCGFAYGTSANPDITGAKVAGSGTTGYFLGYPTGLIPNTIYHFRAYATNEAGTSYSANATLTTVSSPPVATAATEIGATGFTANCIVPPGNGIISFYSVEVSTNPNFTPLASHSGSSTGIPLAGLFPGTTYYYRMRASNAGGESDFSNVISVTLPVGPPSVGSPTFNSIGTATVTLGATIESNGGAPITASGVAYGTGANPDISGNKVGSSATSGSFTVSVTGLMPNTTYHFRGYATSSLGTGYAEDWSFTTLPTPPVATAASEVGIMGFTANWTAPPGNGSLSYHLEVSTDPGFASPEGSFTSRTSVAVTQLNAGTTYYYRVSAAGASGYGGFSNIMSVTTLPAQPPVVDKPLFFSITAFSARLGATIESNEGGAITGAGIAYGLNPDPDISGNKASSSDTNGGFAVNLSGLSPNTLYHYRGYATNPAGTGYTADATFTTVAGAPKAAAATGVGPGYFTANWTAPAGTAAVTEYRLDVAAGQGFAFPVLGLSDLPVTETSRMVSGLSAGTPYYYRVRALNAGGTSTSSNTVAVTLPLKATGLRIKPQVRPDRYRTSAPVGKAP